MGVEWVWLDGGGEMKGQQTQKRRVGSHGQDSRLWQSWLKLLAERKGCEHCPKPTAARSNHRVEWSPQRIENPGSRRPEGSSSHHGVTWETSLPKCHELSPDGLLLCFSHCSLQNKTQPPAPPCPQEPSPLPRKRGWFLPKTWVPAESSMLGKQGWALYSTPVFFLHVVPPSCLSEIQKHSPWDRPCSNQRYLAMLTADPK